MIAILAVDFGNGGPDLINDVANQYINAINNGFGLIRGDVTWILNVLIILSIMWSAVLWTISDDHVIVHFARKIVYIGMFAWIIQNWQTLTDKLASSFMDLGLKAGGFDGASYYTSQPGNIQYYDYAPGIVYTAITSPGFVTTIALRPGEKLLTAAAGDTTRWMVDNVQSGSGDSAQTLLLVKPRKSGLQTNMLITTDQRVYTLDLTSVDSGTYHTMIAWNYPYSDAVMIRNQVAAQQEAARTTVATGLDLSKANFNYLILKQRHATTPPWCPIRAFDDGQKTYIQFPPKVSVTEAPPLFVLGKNGDAQLVNYRVKGDWYIVDRLFSKAELRLGQAPQMVIAIVRADSKD